MILFVTTASIAQGETILHSPVNYATEGLPVAIEAEIERGSEIPVEARIYYRMSGQDAYNYIEAKINRFRLKGVIPGRVIQDGALEYYFEVTFSDDRKIHHPEGAPVSASPLQAMIRPVSAGEGVGEKALIILSPEPASLLSEDRVLIAVSLMQQIRSIDPSKLAIVFDGIDVTRRASISEDMVTLVIEDVKPGEHHIAFYLKDRKKREKLVGWGFVMRSPEEATRPPGVFKGSVNAGYSHEEVSSEVRDVSWIDGRINGKYTGLDYAAKAYVTSLERGNRQPQNRFMASLRYKALTVRGGDIQPQLSEFSLWGSRTRGAQLALKTKYFNMDAVWGFLRRKVDGSGFFSTVTVVNPITNDTLKSVVDPTLDSTRIDRFITDPSTYSRKLYALRPAFNFSRNITWGINIVKVKDDINSVDYGRRPADNIV
ncbi:MAG: hypothetical protein HQ568_05930, partial [Calditrichaeota bacterium]|nr:hypothetical protein [Calditrichota bacterium]